MSQFKLAPAFVPADVNDIRVTYDGMHNAWAVLQDNEPLYVYEFDDLNDEESQRKNAERTLDWCIAKERKHAVR